VDRRLEARRPGRPGRHDPQAPAGRHGTDRTIELAGSFCLPKPHAIQGSFDGAAITFKVNDADVHATYTGRLAGNALSGTATVTCSYGTGTGPWQVTKP
jgi:hypothetical protein